MGRKSAKQKQKNKADRPPALALADVGPKERYQHGDVIERRETIQAGVKGARVLTVSMIDRYRHKKQITVKQSDAALKLRADWEMAGRQMAVTGTYGQAGQGNPEMSDMAALASARYVKATRAVGVELSPILVHVALLDGSASDWAKTTQREPKSGIEILRLALDALARHYGLT